MRTDKNTIEQIFRDDENLLVIEHNINDDGTRSGATKLLSDYDYIVAEVSEKIALALDDDEIDSLWHLDEDCYMKDSLAISETLNLELEYDEECDYILGYVYYEYRSLDEDSGWVEKWTNREQDSTWYITLPMSEIKAMTRANKLTDLGL